jgi:hypothetical protein
VPTFPSANGLFLPRPFQPYAVGMPATSCWPPLSRARRTRRCCRPGRWPWPSRSVLGRGAGRGRDRRSLTLPVVIAVVWATKVRPSSSPWGFESSCTVTSYSTGSSTSLLFPEHPTPTCRQCEHYRRHRRGHRAEGIPSRGPWEEGRTETKVKDGNLSTSRRGLEGERIACGHLRRFRGTI